VGSFAGIASSLNEFGRKTGLPIYIDIAEALEALEDAAEMLEEDLPPAEELPCVFVSAIVVAAARVATSLFITTDEEMLTATHLVMGHSVVEVPGKWNRTGDGEPDLIVLPESRTISDLITVPCKREDSLMKQTRHVKQVSNLLISMDSIRRTLLRANAGQCGRDSAHCSLPTVRAVALMEYPAALTHAETSEASLYCVTTLHRFGLPLDYAKLDDFILREMCSCCNAPLWDPWMQSTRVVRIFVWQSPLGRCGGGWPSSSST